MENFGDFMNMIKDECGNVPITVGTFVSIRHSDMESFLTPNINATVPVEYGPLSVSLHLRTDMVQYSLIDGRMHVKLIFI